MVQHDFVGLWILESIDRVTSDGVTWSATEPYGYLLYAADGKLAESFTTKDPATGELRHVMYAGTWESLGAGKVAHIPSLHMDPTQVGKKLERGIAVVGNELVLTTESAGSATSLIWRKA